MTFIKVKYSSCQKKQTNKSIVRHILVQIVNQNFECCENGFHDDD
jgi:hypothetical protein